MIFISQMSHQVRFHGIKQGLSTLETSTSLIISFDTLNSPMLQGRHFISSLNRQFSTDTLWLCQTGAKKSEVSIKLYETQRASKFHSIFKDRIDWFSSHIYHFCLCFRVHTCEINNYGWHTFLLCICHITLENMSH